MTARFFPNSFEAGWRLALSRVSGIAMLSSPFVCPPGVLSYGLEHIRSGILAKWQM